jgi:hypothetical protein
MEELRQGDHRKRIHSLTPISSQLNLGRNKKIAISKAYEKIFSGI